MSPLLIPVTVLAPAFAAPPLDAEPAEAPPIGTIRFEGGDLHVLVDEDTSEPSVVAFALVVRILRGQAAATPSSWELDQARRALTSDTPPFANVREGPVSIVLTAPAVAALRAEWGTTARWHDRILLAATPDGPVVLADPGPDLPLKAGDVLLAIGQRSVTGLYDIDRFDAFHPMQVLRNGTEVVLDPLVVPIPSDLDLIQRAPTCGPCCHGHCGDDVEPKSIPGLE